MSLKAPKLLPLKKVILGCLYNLVQSRRVLFKLPNGPPPHRMVLFLQCGRDGLGEGQFDNIFLKLSLTLCQCIVFFPGFLNLCNLCDACHCTVQHDACVLAWSVSWDECSSLYFV